MLTYVQVDVGVDKTPQNNVDDEKLEGRDENIVYVNFSVNVRSCDV